LVEKRLWLKRDVADVCRSRGTTDLLEGRANREKFVWRLTRLLLHGKIITEGRGRGEPLPVQGIGRQIRVRQGKGKKDRYTVLSEVALAAIREYREVYLPRDWLFPGARDTTD